MIAGSTSDHDILHLHAYIKDPKRNHNFDSCRYDPYNPNPNKDPWMLPNIGIMGLGVGAMWGTDYMNGASKYHP